jgi:hypothetical protein
VHLGGSWRALIVFALLTPDLRVHIHGPDDRQPTQPPPGGNQTGQAPALGSGRCGWRGLLAVLTDTLGRGSTVVGCNQDVM